MNFILLFTIIWIVITFMTLPLGVKIPEQIKEGWADSAPTNPNIGIKMLFSGMVSLALAVGFWIFFN